VEILIAVLLGIGIGCGVTLFIFKTKNIGTLRLDASDPYEKPYLFLELKNECGNILKKKYVILEVNPKPYISQN
jgi:hypothetical protein